MLNFGKRRNYSNLDDGSPERSTLPTASTRLRKLVPVILIFGIAGITCVFLFVSSNKGGGVGSSAEPLLEKGKYGSKESKGLNSNITQVRISTGILEGIVLKSRRGRDFSAFYNIPYAKPAIGELRFEPPQEFTERWAGKKNFQLMNTYKVKLILRPLNDWKYNIQIFFRNSKCKPTRDILHPNFVVQFRNWGQG